MLLGLLIFGALILVVFGVLQVVLVVHFGATENALGAMGQWVGAAFTAIAAGVAAWAAWGTWRAIDTTRNAAEQQKRAAAVQALLVRYAEEKTYAALQSFGRFMGEVVDQVDHLTAPLTGRAALRSCLRLNSDGMTFDDEKADLGDRRETYIDVARRAYELAVAVSAEAAKQAAVPQLLPEEGRMERPGVVVLAFMLLRLDYPKGGDLDRGQTWPVISGERADRSRAFRQGQALAGQGLRTGGGQVGKEPNRASPPYTSPLQARLGSAPVRSDCR
jgi:hypothetical protein